MPQSRQRSWPRSVAAALAMTFGLAASGCSDGGGDAESLVSQARQYRQKGEASAAVIQLKNALRDNPDHAVARALLGELYIEQGDAISAEKELRRALALGVPSVELSALLGKALLLQGQYQRVLDDIDAGAEGAARPAILALRGEALLGLGQAEKARALFGQALELDPASSSALLGLSRLALAQRRPEDAGALIARALAARPDDVDCLRFQGDLLRLQGKEDAALASYRRILALRPHHGQAHIDVANIHTDNGRFKEARAALAAARKISSGTVGIFYAQAMLDFREGKYAAALESLQKIMRVAPDHLPTILLLGAVQSARGANQQAEQHLNNFLAAFPGHVYASKLMAALHLRANNPDTALRLIGPLMAGNAGDVELLTLAGEANMRTRQFSRAAEYFEKASAVRPDTATLHTAVALSRLGNGDNARALAELERAARLDSKSPRNGVLLVMSYLRANAPDKALAAVAALEADGSNPLLHNLKGAIYLARLDLKGARASFEKSLALDPLYMPALDNLATLDTLEKRKGDAARRYQAALAKAPSSLALMEALARLAAAQGNNVEAIAWLERASKAHPEALGPAMRLADLHSRTGQKQKALVLAQKLQASNPSNPDALALLAHLYHLNENYQSAADSYASLAALMPGAAAPHMRLATARLAARDQAGAIAALRKALSIDPALLDANLGLHKLLIGQNKFAEAMALALAVQKRHPGSPAGFKLEGDAHSAQGRHGAALVAYERAFGMEKSALLLVGLHGALARSGKAAEADARMAGWLKDHPADVPTRLYYASTKVVGNDPAGAIEQLKTVLKHDPKNVVALNDLAWTAHGMRDKSARGYAEQAYRLAPNSATVMDTLGWIELDDGNLARALPLLQKASALAPGAGDIRYRFGMALARSGDKRGARRELERALASSAPFSRRAEAKALLATL